MARLRPFTIVLILLIPALILLILTVISAPITHFSSLGSANGTKFGVFGYCYNNGTCSGINIGYSPDDAINSASSTASKRSLDYFHDKRDLPTANGRLARRQSTGGSGAGAGGDDAGGGSDNPGMFNLPSSARDGLSNVLVAHVVAAGLTLILILLVGFGHMAGPSDSVKYMLALIIFSVITVIITLLCFLVDILIFVPNLDWGTYVTLAATILVTVASILLCTARRTLSTRRAMRKRIAENDDMNAQSYYNSEHLQDSHETVLAREGIKEEEEEVDKATLPRFTQYEYDHPDPAVMETRPLNARDVDSRSVRSETPSLTSPPKYPTPPSGHHYGNVHEMQVLQPPMGHDEEFAPARIPYGRPPRSNDSSRARAFPREHSSDSVGSAGRMALDPPLAHAEEPLMGGYGGGGNGERTRDWRGPTAQTLAVDDWSSRNRQPSAQNRERRQRVVSGPRPMPGGGGGDNNSAAHGRSGDTYYEDVPPQFDTTFNDGDFPEPRPAYGSRRHTPHGSASFDRPAYPQQPRSPDTLSNSSHFTSVSQRGINPAWRGDGMQPSQSYNGAGMQSSYGRGPRQERARGPPKPNILADNPDFVLPGTGSGNRRLPGSRRPNNLPGLASALGAGQSPYAITKTA